MTILYGLAAIRYGTESDMICKRSSYLPSLDLVQRENQYFLADIRTKPFLSAIILQNYNHAHESRSTDCAMCARGTDVLYRALVIHGIT